MAPTVQSSVGEAALGEWVKVAREHKTALVAVAVLAVTPLLYSAAVRRRLSQRRARASDIKLSDAERSAVHRLYRSTLQAAADQRWHEHHLSESVELEFSQRRAVLDSSRPPTRCVDDSVTIDWARVLRSGMNAIDNQNRYDPAEILGLTIGTDGQQVELEDLETSFKQMKADGINEPTVLAICKHIMLMEQAHHIAQVTTAKRKAAERKRSEQHNASEGTIKTPRALAAGAKRGEVSEGLRALFPSLRGGDCCSSVFTAPLEAAELRRCAVQARQAAGGDGSTGKTDPISAVKGQGHVEEVDEEGVDALRRAKPTDGSLLGSVESSSTA